MNVDLYVWAAPRDLDDERAAALIEAWEGRGGDPAESPFEPSVDTGWFARELRRDNPSLEIQTDAVPNPSRMPIVLSGTDEPPARVIAVRIPAGSHDDAHDDVFALAAKYDLLVFDAATGRLHAPLAELAADASATFWPAGAIQAAVAGGAGGIVAVGAWLLGIPVISGVVALVGGFMFVMAVVTFVVEGRKAVRR
jgi:hypothetical protein